MFRELERNYLMQIADIMKNLDAEAAATQAQSPAIVLSQLPLSKIDGSKYERNDKIVVTKNGEDKEVKYKKLGEALSEGWELKTETRRS